MFFKLVRLFVPMLGFMLRLTPICYEPNYPTYPMSLDVDYDQLWIYVYIDILQQMR